MNEKRIEAMRVAKGYHILPVKPGMQLELREHVGEGNNKRIWRFKGLVIKVKKANHADGSFTIRGKVAGQTIEKIYPLSFPNFEKVLLLDQYKIRRAKLYYIRDKVGKDARMKSILTANDKGIDLLELAVEEINALTKAYEESQQTETEEPVESTAVNSEEITTQEDSSEAESSTKETQTEQSVEESTNTSEPAPVEELPTESEEK